MKAQLRKQFLAQAEQVVTTIRAEMEKRREAPATPPTFRQLEVVLRRIDGMQRQVAQGALPSRHSRHSGLGRLLVDEWPLGHKLVAGIAELEDLYLRL